MAENRLRTRVVVVVLALVIAAVAVARADRREAAPSRTSFSAFPMELGEWRGVEQPPLTQQVLAILGVTDYITRIYVSPTRDSVGLYSGYWNSQRQGDTIHSPLNCLPGAGWEPISNTKMDIPDPRQSSDAKIRVNRVVIQKGIERQLVLYRYQSHGRIVASEYWGKVYLVTDAVTLNRTDGALVRVTTRIKSDDAAGAEAAERLAIDFVNVLLPSLNGYLPS